MYHWLIENQCSDDWVNALLTGERKIAQCGCDQQRPAGSVSLCLYVQRWDQLQFEVQSVVAQFVVLMHLRWFSAACALLLHWRWRCTGARLVVHSCCTLSAMLLHSICTGGALLLHCWCSSFSRKVNWPPLRSVSQRWIQWRGSATVTVPLWLRHIMMSKVGFGLDQNKVI